MNNTKIQIKLLSAQAAEFSQKAADLLNDERVKKAYLG